MSFVRRHIPVVLLLFWAALTFFVRVPWQPTPPADSGRTWHRVLLLSDGLQKTKTTRYEAVLLDSADLRTTSPELLLYVRNDTTRPPFRAGDLLLVYDSLSGHAAYISTAGRLTSYSGQLPLRWQVQCSAIRVRTRLERTLAQYIKGEEERALIESIVLGDRRQLQPDQRRAFQEAGAMHVLAVSGMHVGVVAALIVWLLSLGGLWTMPWQKRGWYALRRVLEMLLIWGYAFLTGLSTPVLRAALMFSMMPLLRHSESLTVRLNRLAMAALIILVINPSALCSASFLLSFSAVLALQLCSAWQPQLRLRPRVLTKPVNKLLQALFAALAAQLGTLPWTIVFFRQVSVWFFLTALWIGLSVEVLMGATLTALALSFAPLPDSLLSVLFTAIEWCAWLINQGVLLIQHLPAAVIYL